jgi:predicted dehydrogenase
MVLNGAIVGFGNVARHGHWPAYEQSRSLRIVALVDPHSARQTAHHDLPVYPSITLAASDRRLDFVDICAPPVWHAPLVLEALSLNLHAIVEKPLALTTDDFDEVARDALARSRIVLPVHNWRHAPALQQASAALRRGDIGALRSAEIDVWRPAACGSADSPAWRQNRAVAGGGIVLDHGWHAFYLMMEWFGGRPDTVDGWCHAEPPQDVETDADITLGFAGRTGVIRLTWRGPRRRNRVLLTGDAGSIEIDDDLYVITNEDGEDRRRTASLSEGSYHPDWFPHVLTDFERTLGDRAAAARVLDEAGACVQIADRVYNAALRRRSGQATVCSGRTFVDCDASGVVPVGRVSASACRADRSTHRAARTCWIRCVEPRSSTGGCRHLPRGDCRGPEERDAPPRRGDGRGAGAAATATRKTSSNARSRWTKR